MPLASWGLPLTCFQNTGAQCFPSYRKELPFFSRCPWSKLRFLLPNSIYPKIPPQQKLPGQTGLAGLASQEPHLSRVLSLKHLGSVFSFLWNRTVLLIYTEMAKIGVPPPKFPISKGCFQTKAIRTETSCCLRPLIAAFHLPLKHRCSVLFFTWKRIVFLLQVSMSEIGIPPQKFPISEGCSQPKSASTVKSGWPWPLVAAPATLGLDSFLPMEIPVTLWAPHGTKGIIVAPLEPMEPRGHGDTAGLHGPRDHHDSVRPDGTMEAMRTLQGLVSPRGIVTPQGLLGARDHWDTVGPHGTEGTWNRSGWLGLPGAT
ncbi:uncharacterized protein LOC128783186 [Vidua chalybeata]|uniref:uncharacterized protein LOC128783186 n=1 Tax=Vidua chalybeata TaxID=81927 RepID=UPI0023A90140|nr:uncharacterized protein LOC128783186 [Vidua chalybeata]